MEYKGRWVTDDYMAGQIEKAFAESDGPLFHYTTTIQNHMSYTADKYGPDYEFPPLETSAALSETAETLLRVYVEGARDADAMLGRLWRFLQSQEKPAVLVYWGDHLPYLGDNQLAYRELGLEIGQEADGQMSLESYETPYVIWANDAAAEALHWDQAAASLDLPEGGKLSASFLGAAVLELTGRGESTPWFAFLNQLRRETPVVQKTYCEDSAGRALEEPSEEIAKWRRWSYYKLCYKDVA